MSKFKKKEKRLHYADVSLRVSHVVAEANERRLDSQATITNFRIAYRSGIHMAFVLDLISAMTL